MRRRFIIIFYFSFMLLMLCPVCYGQEGTVELRGYVSAVHRIVNPFTGKLEGMADIGAMGAEVTICCGGDTVSVKTDRHGLFEARGLRKGSMTLAISWEGQNFTKYSGVFELLEPENLLIVQLFEKKEIPGDGNLDVESDEGLFSLDGDVLEYNALGMTGGGNPFAMDMLKKSSHIEVKGNEAKIDTSHVSIQYHDGTYLFSQSK